MIYNIRMLHSSRVTKLFYFQKVLKVPKNVLTQKSNFFPKFPFEHKRCLIFWNKYYIVQKSHHHYYWHFNSTGFKQYNHTKELLVKHHCQWRRKENVCQNGSLCGSSNTTLCQAFSFSGDLHFNVWGWLVWDRGNLT